MRTVEGENCGGCRQCGWLRMRTVKDEDKVFENLSVAKRKSCLRQKRHRAGSVSLFCAIVSSSD